MNPFTVDGHVILYQGEAICVAYFDDLAETLVNDLNEHYRKGEDLGWHDTFTVLGMAERGTADSVIPWQEPGGEK